MDDPRYPVGSAGSVLLLLNMLAEDGHVGVTQVARELGVGKSTAHRLLAMLKSHGFAVQDKHRAYRIGPAFEHAGRRVTQNIEVRKIAQPHLVRLAEELDVSASLMVLVGNGARFVESLEPVGRRRLGERRGLLLPAHATAGGKAMLAQLSPQELWALYPRGVPATRLGTERTLPGLLKELSVVRQRGYAVNREESGPGIAAVGCHVRHAEPTMRIGLAVATPAPAATHDVVENLADHLLKASVRLSECLT